MKGSADYKWIGVGILDQLECSCGWKSPVFYDGSQYAESAWKRHVKEDHMANLEEAMVKVGDCVTWRNAEKPHALGVTGCKVLELGETEDGRPAAKLDLGQMGEANALVSDLTIEPDRPE